jgi:hypothetical protein
MNVFVDGSRLDDETLRSRSIQQREGGMNNWRMNVYLDGWDYGD